MLLQRLQHRGLPARRLPARAGVGAATGLRIDACAAPSSLSPRQRKLAAKKKAKEQQRQQKQQLQPEEQPEQPKQPSLSRPPAKPAATPAVATGVEAVAAAAAATSQKPPLPSLLTSLQHCMEAAAGSSPHAELSALTPTQSLQLLLLWADQSRSLDAPALHSAPVQRLVDALLPAMQQGAAGGFDRQELAEAAWGLAHFERPESQLPAASTHTSSTSSTTSSIKTNTNTSSTSTGTSTSSSSSSTISTSHAVNRSTDFEQAMQVPFRVIPAAMRDLQLAAFLAELRPQLKRDVIYLDGGARAVEVGA